MAARSGRGALCYCPPSYFAGVRDVGALHSRLKIKNIEWGAVAYLSQSIYGRNAEIWNNPSWDYITGCAGESLAAEHFSGCINYYDSDNGQKASTTGNIYGIYDMVGGAL